MIFLIIFSFCEKMSSLNDQDLHQILRQMWLDYFKKIAEENEKLKQEREDWLKCKVRYEKMMFELNTDKFMFMCSNCNEIWYIDDITSHCETDIYYIYYCKKCYESFPDKICVCGKKFSDLRD